MSLANPSIYSRTSINRAGAPELVTVQEITQTSDITTTATAYEDATDMTLTLANYTGGKFFASLCATTAHSAWLAPVYLRFVDGAVNKSGVASDGAPIAATRRRTQGTVLTGDTDGDTLKIEWHVDSGTGTMYGSTDGASQLAVIEIPDNGSFTISNQRDVLSGNETTTSSTFVDLPNLTLTLANVTDGKFYAICNVCGHGSGNSQLLSIRFVDGSTNKNGAQFHAPSDFGTTRLHNMCHNAVGNLDGDILKIQFKISTGTFTASGVAESFSQFHILEIA